MTRKNKIIQQGGMYGTPLPTEVFGNNSGRYFPAGSPELMMGNSAYGVNVPTSRGTIIAPGLMGPELGPTGHSGTQTGGRHRSKTQTGGRRRSKTQTGGRRRSKTQTGGRRRSKTQTGGRRRSNVQKAARRSKTNATRKRSKTQNAGGNPFKIITNPETGRQVNLHGSLGKKILMNYLKH